MRVKASPLILKTKEWWSHADKYCITTFEQVSRFILGVKLMTRTMERMKRFLVKKEGKKEGMYCKFSTKLNAKIFINVSMFYSPGGIQWEKYSYLPIFLWNVVK